MLKSLLFHLISENITKTIGFKQKYFDIFDFLSNKKLSNIFQETNVL